jgi:hypothetical protein
MKLSTTLSEKGPLLECQDQPRGDKVFRKVLETAEVGC